MTKRIALLVVVLTIFAAPTLLADHCFRCKIVPAGEISSCILYTNPNFQIGWTECSDDEFGCYPTGNRCFGHSALSVSLADEYTIASVERLDEPQTEPQTAKAGTAVADATLSAR
ncbi:MAG TPA: hypothetical protein VFP80_15245 [Thermoanaerobaculia bacterium]|nr:hypothetical protein [Thermoanaerobaculia bacterium]